MSDSLEKLMKQVQLQKLQLECSNLFQRNLRVFAQRFPEIHELFKAYKPQRFQLGITPTEELNLVDTEAKHFVYASAPQDQAKKQIERFKNRIQVRKFRVPKTPVYNPEHLHIPKLNDMIDAYEKNSVARVTKTPKYILNLVLSGVGMGYQLPYLVNDFDIQNIFIYENCKDSFHASLHVIDWEPILNYFAADGRSISLCIGVDPRKALSQIEFSIRKMGLHSQIFSFMLQHSQRKQELDFISIYQSEIRSFLGGLGYFDDEQIGIGHAYHNLCSKHAVFTLPRLANREERLVVVGNGPSLDFHIEYLKENQEDLIILSCGSALGSLHRAGIQPDFHVEMERDYAMTDYIKFDTPVEFRKDITLLCLHSVAPETLNQFGKACYAAKIHDAGAPLVHQYYEEKEIVELAFCNPTVSNCAMAFAIYMGFNNIHIIGTDFGVTEDGKHHSKNSLHYDMEDFVEDKSEFAYNYKDGKEKLVEANFGGVVKTHHILDTSRVAIERLLDFATKKSTSFKCYNSNHGAKIRNTLPTRLENIPKPKQIDKKSLLKAIESDYFYYNQNTGFESLSSEKILERFFDIQEEIKIKEGISNDQSLIIELNRIFKTVAMEYDPITHFLLRGSMSCFFGSIVENTLYSAEESDFNKQLCIGRTHYNNFVDLVFERAKAEPFKIDNFPLELLHKMQNTPQD